MVLSSDDKKSIELIETKKISNIICSGDVRNRRYFLDLVDNEQSMSRVVNLITS